MQPRVSAQARFMNTADNRGYVSDQRLSNGEQGLQGWIRRHWVAGSATASLMLSATGLLLPWKYFGGWWPVATFVLIGAYITIMALICWPLRSNRRIVLANAVAGVAYATFNVIRMLVGMEAAFTYKLALAGPVFVSGAILRGGTGFLVLGLAGLIRNKLYPVYAEGCCRACGYDLRGQEDARCPECGAGFEWNRERDEEEPEHSCRDRPGRV